MSARFAAALFVATVSFALSAQEVQEPVPAGKVVFSRSADDVRAADKTSAADVVPAKPVTGAERASILITAYDLDLHLIPESARLETRANLTLRNIGASPISRIPMQISSTLRWETLAVRGQASVGFTQSPIATDTDHTGYAQEAVLALATPLAPGATIAVTAFYSGEIHRSAARLEMIGTPAAVAAQTDWDQITDSDAEIPTALRGFGNVLWYPCAEPIALLGDGNRLFALVGQTRLAEVDATFKLRLTVEYTGEAPGVAIFDGQLQPFDHAADTNDQLVAETHGIATASFAPRPIGFRVPSLFLAEGAPPADAGAMIAIMTTRDGVEVPYLAAADSAKPIVTDWLGETPSRPLILVDHEGQTFEDEALLVTPLQGQSPADQLVPILVHGMTHAWLRSSHPWIAEGFAQFMNLVWLEQSQGRPAAIAELQRQANLIALAEPEVAEGSGQPLTNASSEIYFRAKAAAVWWQLRDILGDQVLQKGMQAYRLSEMGSAAFDRDPKSLQKTLERISSRDLNWFFDDWVNRDRSLPDLSIVAVTPHPLPVIAGKDPGFLVAVEVRNDGDAVAEVAVTIRSGELSASERLRIPGHASAATRIPFQGTPQIVQVNDGSVPELRTTVHTRTVIEK